MLIPLAEGCARGDSVSPEKQDCEHSYAVRTLSAFPPGLTGK